MSEKLTYTPKENAQTLTSISLDMQALTQRMADPSFEALLGSDKDLRCKTGVEVARELSREVDEQLLKGDMKPLLRTLQAQAYTLNKVFMRMVSNEPETMTGEKHYFELAMKAQNQCRRTLQSIADIAAPRQATFIKQQNNGTNVQVNNNEAPEANLAPPEPIHEVQKKKA